MPARSIDACEIHHLAVSKYTVVLAITADGHVATAHGESPAEARAQLADWLATLPPLTEGVPAAEPAP